MLEAIRTTGKLETETENGLKAALDELVAQFGSDLDADTKARLALGERIVAVLKQKNNAPKEVAQQVCIIYAVTHGYLSTIPVEKIPEFEKQLEEHMDNYHSQVLEAIRTTGKLETETENQLKTALNELIERFA